MAGESKDIQGASPSGSGHPCSAPIPQTVSASGGSPSRETALALVAGHIAALRDEARAMEAVYDLFRPEFEACWARDDDGRMGEMLAPERALQLRSLVLTNRDEAKATRRLADAIETLIAPRDGSGEAGKTRSGLTEEGCASSSQDWSGQIPR